MSDNTENLYSPPKSSPDVEEASPKKMNSIWVGLAVFFLVGIYANLFIPAANGIAPAPDVLAGSTFWHVVAFVIFWKRRQKNPWVGGAIGALAGIIAPILAVVISGASR